MSHAASTISTALEAELEAELARALAMEASPKNLAEDDLEANDDGHSDSDPADCDQPLFWGST